MFSKFFRQQTEFEIGLLNSSILNNKPSLNIQDLKALMQGFPQQIQQCRTPQPIKKTFQKFFQSLPDKISFRVKLKILATCHVLLDDFLHGEKFSEQILEWGGFRYKQPIRTQNCGKVEIYYNVLRDVTAFFKWYKFAENGQIVEKLQFTKQSIHISLAFPDNQSNYYKAINLLNLIFTNTQFIKQSLESMQEEILGEIVLLIWNDVIAIYLFIEKIILQFVAEFQGVQSQLFFQVYELLPDFIRLTQQIQLFYRLNDHFQEEKQFSEPNWKILDQKLLDEIDFFKQKLIIQSARGRLVKKNSKASFSTQLLSPQHQSQGSFFTNTTLGYVKRLSTVDDPFENCEEVSKKFKNLIK